MESLFGLSFILLIIAACLTANESSKKKKSKQYQNNSYYEQRPIQPTYSPAITNNYLPYKRRFLLTKTEYAFYNTLKPTCDTYDLLICPKVRLEDLAEVTTHKNQMKYRGYIKSRHVDFIICDNKLNIIAAIELADYSHNTAKARDVDNFKNNFFQAISIPLFRIVVCNNYEGQLSYMIGSLGLSKPITNTNVETKKEPATGSTLTMDSIINNKLNDLIEKQNALLVEQNKLFALLQNQTHNS